MARSGRGTARARYEEALPLYRKIGYVLGEGNCVLGLGQIALMHSDHDAARVRFEEAQPLYRRVGSLLGEANCSKGLGDIARARSDDGAARVLYQKALTLYERIPEPYSIGQAHRLLARVAANKRDRKLHVEAARRSWQSIKRDDLVRDLDAEFSS